jgi:hypothetical protein
MRGKEKARGPEELFETWGPLSAARGARRGETLDRPLSSERKRSGSRGRRRRVMTPRDRSPNPLVKVVQHYLGE